MPEPKNARRTFQSQVESQLNGLRLVSQETNIPQGTEPGLPGEANAKHPYTVEIQPPEAALVSKLIGFIKKI